MSRPVVHFEISCKNADSQQAFYEKVLGWKCELFPQMNYRMVNPPEGRTSPAIGGGLMQSDQGHSYVTVYAEVDDIQAYLDKAEAAGGKTVLPPMEIGDGMGSVGMFLDPEGNPFGLYKPGQQP